MKLKVHVTMSQFSLKLLCSTAVICLIAGAPVSAQQLEQKTDPAAGIVFEINPMVPLLEKGRIGSVSLQDPEGIYKFYKARNFESLWTDKDKIARRTDDAIKLIENSWEHGFNPENYHFKEIKAQIEADDLSDPLGFEIMMSDAVARYGKDLTGMRLSPRTLGEDTKSWSRGLDAEQLLTMAAEKNNPTDALEKLVPQGRLYKDLQNELKRILKDLEENPEANGKPIAFPGLIYPRKSHPTIKLIRERFGVQSAIGYTPQFYDDDLIEAVMNFQKANGLKPDGIIGQRTIDAINQGRRDRLVKILANMERLRWMPELPEKYLVVNVPAMTLWAYENSKLAFEMPVIVGKESWPTTSFKTDITGIRFNPSWYVPPSIQTKDILPELRQNPDILAKKNLQLLYYTSDGARPISPRDVKWDQITDADMKNFAMIQNPGDENPLGKIRVLMPNQYNIYLHDTNSPDLFTKDFRALSHGCIRLSEPRRIADFILDQNGDWSKERLENILSKKNTIEVASREKVPVFILYQTIWEDGNGEMIYGQDIYKSDEKLVQELVKKEKLSIKIN